MKRYIRNKGFIPEKFIDKVKNRNLKHEKKVLFILLCFNLIYLPFNIQLLNESRNKQVEKVNVESYSNKKGFDLAKVYSMAEILLKHNIKECNVSNDGGNVVVEGMADVNEISKNEIIKVEEVELRNDDNFELKVSGYE